MFNLRNRILVIASNVDTDGALALANYGSLNADRLTLEAFMAKAELSHSQYLSISLFVSENFEAVANMTTVTKIFRSVHPGGTVIFHLAVSKDESGEKVISLFKKFAIYSGFVNPNVARDKENAQFRRTVQIVAQRPQWSLGSSAEMDQLIDESTLQDDITEYKPMSGGGLLDCAVKTRACDNCTCGRKELEISLGAEEAKKRLETAAVRSSCGNCYLGDAFRCSSCPYKGQPAFKPGQKVQLDMLTNKQDANNSGLSEVLASTSTAGAALKLQL